MEKPTTARKGVAAAAALVVVGAWILCAVSYATDGGGGYNAGLFAAFGLVAVALTVVTGILTGLAWAGKSGVAAAVVASVPATAAVLWLALALRLRG